MNRLFLCLFLIVASPVQGQPSLPVDKANPDMQAPKLDAPQFQDFGDENGQSALSRERQEATRAISWYNEKIEEIETEEGAYSDALSELLLGLGDTYAKLNNLDEAAQSYKRALQVHRVNEGLYDLGQTPLLERLLKVNATLNNHEELESHYDYLLWLHRRNYDNQDSNLLPALIRVASWKLEAYAANPGEGRVRHLYEVDDLFDEALDILETPSDLEASAAIKFLFGIAEANVKAQFFIDSSQFVEDALRAIIAIHDRHPELPKASLAQAWVLLGDWQMSLRDSGDAIEHYQQAYQTLGKNAESPGAIQRLFAQPRAIHTLDTLTILERMGFEFFHQQDFSTRSGFTTYSRFSSRGGVSDYNELLRRNKLSRHRTFPRRTGFYDSNSLLERQISSEVIPNRRRQLNDVVAQRLNLGNTEYVLVELDVSERGRARDIDILESNPADSVRFRREARALISDLPFRPRLEEGEPVETKDFVMLFRFE